MNKKYPVLDVVQAFELLNCFCVCFTRGLPQDLQWNDKCNHLNAQEKIK